MMHQITGAPIVTAIMPTHNHAAFVGAAIESVLAQTLETWELIVVDDGSTDRTLEVVRRYQDPRIALIARDHGGLSGLGETYRAALESSSSPLVAIIEGDDTWPPDKLARQVPDFDDPAVVLSYGAGWLIDEFGCRYGRVDPSFPPATRTNRPVGAIVPGLLLNNAILSPTVVLRRSALESIGGFWQPAGVPYLDHPTWLLSAPEEAYLGLAVERLRGLVAGPAPLPPDAETIGRHSERAMVNRWRLALLSAGPGEILRSYVRMIRTGRPRLIGLAIAGLAARGVGSDLEWLQIRRHRVAWPSRRHMRRHRRRSALPTKATERSSR